MISLFTSTQYPAELERYVSVDAVKSRDLRGVSVLLHAATGEAQLDRLAWLAFALVLGLPRSGHTCVDLENIAQWAPEDLKNDSDEWPIAGKAWKDAVLACQKLVCTPETLNEHPRKPFVVSGNKLYSARSFHEEQLVANYITNAVAEKRVEIITGGPGSGKTTYIANQIVEQIAKNIDTESIALAAPTGLAAKRMDRALRSAVRYGIGEGNISPEMETHVNGLKKLTIHKLLKFNPSSRIQWRHNKANRMPYDYVIVDEVSMMPLSMMARLIEALKDDARLMLVGDPFQLASVDAGTVLADIVEASNKGKTFVNTKTESHRFPIGSPVSDIAIETKAGNVEGALEKMRLHHDTQAKSKFVWVDPVIDDARLQIIAREVVNHARKLCELAASANTDVQYREIIRVRDELQVICAHRKGNLGVSGWNRAVERELGVLAQEQWYLGRPVMVSKNDANTGLANGDIGVVCKDAKGARIVVFGDAEEVKTFSTTSIPQVETVHALTIHKSQGSEFAHTIVVLPKGKSRILTRELLYTGITRAKPNLTLIATQEALEIAIGNKVQRATGLADLL
jgi:exodeoxyribonuclease V alpha subunit